MMLTVLVGHVTVLQTVQDADETQQSTRLCTDVVSTRDIPKHFLPHTPLLCASLILGTQHSFSCSLESAPPHGQEAWDW